MKKLIQIIVFIETILAFIILTSEPDLTLIDYIIKAIALIWIWFVAKANNYFYKKENKK
jgi:hypothetical protein